MYRHGVGMYQVVTSKSRVFLIWRITSKLKFRITTGDFLFSRSQLQDASKLKLTSQSQKQYQVISSRREKSRLFFVAIQITT